jgi:hypothetical protein
MATFTKSEQAEAVERLNAWVKPGDTLYTILRHRASSGMSRSISVIAMRDGQIIDLDYSASRALSIKIDQKNGGLIMRGAGMDMGFQIVYQLGYVLYRDGFGCIGDGCHSNDHSNGDRDYTRNSESLEPHWHRDGGYAFRHSWL